MTKLDALWAYQEAELRRAQLEAEIRSTPARQKFNKLHTLLKTQQAAIKKMSDDMEARELRAGRLLEQAEKLEHRIAMERSELDTMAKDEECTAEEMTELRSDVEKLARELSAVLRDAKTLRAEIGSAAEEYHNTRQKAGKAKKEYDTLRVTCESERSEREADIAACEKTLEEAKETVDAALIERYNTVKLHQASPVAKVINNKCGGCNMSLPMVVLKKITGTDAIMECDNCGRILYAAKQ